MFFFLQKIFMQQLEISIKQRVKEKAGNRLLVSLNVALALTWDKNRGEWWRNKNECGVLSRWYFSSLTFLSHYLWSFNNGGGDGAEFDKLLAACKQGRSALVGAISLSTLFINHGHENNQKVVFNGRWRETLMSLFKSSAKTTILKRLQIQK